MKTYLFNAYRNVSIAGCLVLALFVVSSSSNAANGTWTAAAGGSWSTPGNWAGGTVADGPDSTANFATLDILSDTTVTLDTTRTNGSLVFADADTNSPAGWILSGNALTLSGVQPTITVNPGSKATISSVLIGTNGLPATGLTLNGNGRLDLTGVNIFTNMLIDGTTLGVNVVQSPGLNVTNNVLTLTNGATVLIVANTTWNQTLFSRGSNSFARLPGLGGGGNWNGKFTGDGILYVNLAGVQMTFGGNNAWNSNLFSGFTGTILLDGGGNFRFDENNGATTTFGSKAAIWDLGQTNNSLNERGAAGIAQHTTFLGALKGGPATALACNGSPGVTNTFQIGDANIDTTYFGRINNGTATAFTSITKSGTGTLTLAGTNGYSGTTTVQGGRLILAATALMDNTPIIKVVSPGIFDVSSFGLWTNSVGQASFQGNGAITGAVALANCTVAPGIGVNDTATLTFASGLILSNAAARIDTVAPTAVDKVFVNGDLNFIGTNTIQLIPTLANVIVTNGTYVLFQWTGTLNSDWASGLVLSYPTQLGSLTLSTNASKQIVLTVSGAQLVDLTWRGDLSGEWSGAANWRDTNNASTTWADGRIAHFDNTGLIKSVNLGSAVSPARVLVDSTSDYTLGTTGSGKITGAGLLIKNGSGRLLLTANNDYTGATTINSNATLQIGNGGTTGSVGTGPLTDDGTFIINRSDDVVYSSPINGIGSVLHFGPGVLTMTGDHGYSGLTVVTNNATLQLGNGTVNGTLASTVVLSNGASLNYVYNPNPTTIGNSLSGVGSVTYQFSSGPRTFLYGANVTNTTFTGPILIKTGARVEAGTIASEPGGPITVEDQASFYSHAGAFTNNQSITITGQGPGTGVDQPRGFGALRLNNGWAGPVVMSGAATIGASSGTGIILGNISDGGNGFMLEYFGGTVQVGPAVGVNSYGSTRISEGLTGGAPGVSGNTIVVALNNNAFSTNAIEMIGQTTLRLNGNNIAVANLIDSSTSTAVSNYPPIVENASSNALATLTVGADGNPSTFGGVFGDGGPQPLGLTKTGSGTFTVTGDNTSTGPVTVSGGTLALAASSAFYLNGSPVLGSGSFSNASLITIASGAILDVIGRTDGTLGLNIGQTLGGNGTVNGNVDTHTGSVVNPGSSIGTLNVSGNLNLAGALMMELNRTNGIQSNDLISVTGSFVSTSGTLTVSNIGPALVAGDTFQLFAAGRSFASVNLQTNDTVNNVKYTWINTVGSNGKVTVQSVAPFVNATPAPITFAVSGGTTLDLGWPADRTGFTLQSNAVGLASAASWFEYPAGNGSRGTNHVTLSIDKTRTNVFFRLVYP